MTFTCAKCSWKGYPSFELVNNDVDGRSGGLFAQCNKCQWVDRSLTPALFHAAESAAVPVARPRAPVAPRTAVTASYAEPPDVLTLVRERLAFITAEEARLEGVKADTAARLAGLRVEARKLRRMVAVANRFEDVAPDANHPEH